MRFLILFICIIPMAFSATQKVTLAGGCFWCMEPPFEKLPGVISVVSGYAGGKLKKPTYKQVSSGSTKHREVVQITFDDSKVSFEKLIEVFWTTFDPTDNGGQFVDRGFQYTSAIFYHNEKQKNIALKSKAELDKKKVFSKKIITPILKFTNFYPAEEYHQDYYKKNPIRYKFYRYRSGRDDFLKKHWDKKARLKEKLSELEYKVTQENGTEPAFKNKYWDHKEPGIYVDIVSGEPLFSSKDKFKSGTGWPSFTRPIVKENITEVKDSTFGMVRTEVRSKKADSHLGHVFNDGPAPTKLRYCINSAALRFIPVKDLEKEGLSEFLPVFKSK